MQLGSRYEIGNEGLVGRQHEHRSATDEEGEGQQESGRHQPGEGQDGQRRSDDHEEELDRNQQAAPVEDVGEHMEFHHQQKEYASWQVGPTSVIIYLLLYWLCVPASLYFITRTGWRFTTKVIVAVLTSGVWILIVFAVVALRAQTAQP